jgi:Co/Zn/Cd efflux system component
MKPQYFLMITKFILAIAAFSTFTSVLAQSATIDLCKSASQIMNKSLPIKKDNLTIMRETSCLPSSPKIKFLHIMEISSPIEMVKQIDFKTAIKPNVLNTYCTDPQVRVVLNAFDIEYRYYTNKGEYVGTFLMTSKECK